MVESNYAALGQGLKLYTDAMRGLVKERLIAAYPNTWWQDGVVRTLTEVQKNNLRKDTERDPKKDKLDHIEPAHLVRIVSRNFDHAFQGAFSDFNKTQAWLQQVASARLDWAHPKTGDMLADDVGHALYAMKELLSTAELPEATKVEKLRKEVLGMEEGPAKEGAKKARQAKEGELPYWWQVCEPHDAFKNPAAIDASLFAATLGAVHAGAARDEYLKPDVFFSHTYFTENLKQTIRDVASRLSGGEGPSVTEMQTPFGGGKTHALLTLYHLMNDPKKSRAVPGVKEALGDVSIPSDARVLVFDGQEYGTDPLLKEDGTSVSTMWGELAYQADKSLFRKLIVDSDSRGDAPGNAVFRQVLEAAAPCLILIDELVSYLVKLKFSNTKRTKNLYRQTIQFVQEMLQLVGNVTGVCVLISLPQSRAEFGGLDPQQLQHELAVMPELQARADRVVSKRTPVNDEEIYTLMSKRLFKKADPKAAERAARMYREAYERTRGLYDQTAFSADYLQQQIDAYPLHPELIDVLYKKWSAATDFPRTRAVLQLLANVVADQWKNRREAYAIQSAHVNLEREPIRTKIVSAAGAGGGYDAVIAADIIGGDAHADMVDQRRGDDYERHHIARGIATTLLMHSFGGQTRAGALPSELRLGTVAPNVGPEYVSEVMESMEQSLWYVHREGDLLSFKIRANIYRVISESADSLPAATVVERLREALGNAMGSADGFRTLEWAASDGVIADRPDPAIAVLDPRYAVSQENGDSPVAGRERIDQLWEKAGGGLRQWRNALILVAPDGDLWSNAEEAMREVMAYEMVLDNVEKGSMDLSEAEKKDLRSRCNDKRESLRTSITTAYRWAFYPGEEGLTVVALSVPATRDERIVSRVVERLSDQDYGHPKILTKMGAVYFDSKLAPQVWKDGSNPLELEELSRRFQQWTYLPMLPIREETLRACIREGVGDKLWAIAIGDNTTSKYQKLIETPDELDDVAVLFDGSASLVKGDLLELIREQLGGKKGPLVVKPPGTKEPGEGEDGGASVIPPPSKRLSRVRLRIENLGIAKTSNLQPYLFRVLQEQDAGAEVTVVIEVSSGAGIPADVLEKRIVEAFDQLGITVRWETA